uniref:Putative terminase n=1 Tax=viral metagenome TaxID=1070528 RepID=A0A6M3L4U4_9ZZZZ
MIPRRKDNGNGKIRRRDQIPADSIPNDIYDRLDPEEIAKELFDMKPNRMSPPRWHWLIAFVDEYLKDKVPNAEYAYIRAGGQTKNAKTAGNNLLKMPIVQLLVSKRQLERRQRLNYNLDRVMEELAALAFFNPQDLYNAQGNFIPIHQLPREVAAAISSVKAMVKKNDDGDTDTRTLEFRHWNKNQALELFLRHYGALNDKVQIDVNERRTVTVRVQVEQLKEAYSDDELEQLHRLVAKIPQITAPGTDTQVVGLAGSIRGGNGNGGKAAQEIH